MKLIESDDLILEITRIKSEESKVVFSRLSQATQKVVVGRSFPTPGLNKILLFCFFYSVKVKIKCQKGLYAKQNVLCKTSATIVILLSFFKVQFSKIFATFLCLKLAKKHLCLSNCFVKVLVTTRKRHN